MKKTQIQLMVAVATSLIAFSASAAEPCKAYVKLDLGYAKTFGTRTSGAKFSSGQGATTTSTAVAFESLPLYKDPRGFIGAAGVGYAFNDAMRGEVVLDFRPNMKSSFDGIAVETRELGGSVRLLYDFNNNTPVTPFVFGSLGASNIKPKNKPDTSSAALAATTDTRTLVTVNDTTGAVTSTTALTSVSQKAKTVMTYQGGFGLSFKGSDIMNVDLTYGIGSKGTFVAIKDVGYEDSAKADGGSAPETSTNTTSYQSVSYKKQLDQSLTIGFRFTM